jgi:hypothetical protein
MTLLEAMSDRNLFKPWFRNGASWAAWRAFIAALFALQMSDEQFAIFKECTGRSTRQTSPATEAWLNCGRRSGKSFVLALTAVYLAAFHDYRKFLAPGERGTVLIIAASTKQARVIFRYIRALLTNIPMLTKLVTRETSDTFDLNNGTTIEVHPVSMRTTRGYTIVAALCDEIAFWPHEDAAEPDFAVLQALKPGMATIPNAMLLCASSPYARRGALWDAWRKHFGKDNDPVLVWRAPTRVMNPTVKQELIDAAAEADPASAAAEWMAEFRSDIEALLSREAVEACIAWDVRERAPMERTRYYGFVDPSGGSADSMTLCIGHRDGDTIVIDALRERRPPFSPEDVVVDFATLLKSYHINKITGDRYAGEWPRERFREHGISYECAAKPKSDLYRDNILPLVNSRKLDLLDDQRLVAQLVGLERRTARGTGRDSIDHPPGAHDDLCNAVAGLAGAARCGSYRYDSSLDWVRGPDPDDDFQRQRLSQHILRTGGFYRQWRGL